MNKFIDWLLGLESPPKTEECWGEGNWTFKCIQCRHKFASWTAMKPKICPRCKSPDWDKPIVSKDAKKYKGLQHRHGGAVE